MAMRNSGDRAFVPRGIEVAQGLSYGAIEGIASGVRSVLGVSVADVLPCAELFDQIDRITANEVQLTSGVKQLSPQFEGLTRYDPEQRRVELLLSEPTYDGLLDGVPRAWFAFVHELGHGVLHTADVIRLAEMPHPLAGLNRGGARHAAYLDSEWQADAFAAAVLMPALGLERLERKGHLSIERVMRDYRVSQQAAQFRLNRFASRRGELLH